MHPVLSKSDRLKRVVNPQNLDKVLPQNRRCSRWQNQLLTKLKFPLSDFLKVETWLKIFRSSRRIWRESKNCSPTQTKKKKRLTKASNNSTKWFQISRMLLYLKLLRRSKLRPKWINLPRNLHKGCRSRSRKLEKAMRISSFRKSDCSLTLARVQKKQRKLSNLIKMFRWKRLSIKLNQHKLCSLKREKHSQ